jgi:hypothetical protein
MMKTPKIEVFLLKYRVPSLGPPKINHQNKKERKKHLHEKFTVQVKSEQSNLHTKHNLNKKRPLPHHPPEKKEVSSFHNSTSHWFHGNSFLKIGCHYFSPGLIALPKNTLPICNN